MGNELQQQQGYPGLYHPGQLGGGQIVMMGGGGGGGQIVMMDPMMGGGGGGQLAVMDGQLVLIPGMLQGGGGQLVALEIDDDSRPSGGYEGHTLTLYHQTDEAGARSILSEQKMLRGSSGLAGGGIYFAESPSATEGKAHQHGVILRARVRVGRYMETSSPDSDMTYSRLRSMGYDSVKITGRRTGIEWVVYNHGQVDMISREEEYW